MKSSPLSTLITSPKSSVANNSYFGLYETPEFVSENLSQIRILNTPDLYSGNKRDNRRKESLDGMEEGIEEEEDFQEGDLETFAASTCDYQNLPFADQYSASLSIDEIQSMLDDAQSYTLESIQINGSREFDENDSTFQSEYDKQLQFISEDMNQKADESNEEILLAKVEQLYAERVLMKTSQKNRGRSQNESIPSVINNLDDKEEKRRKNRKEKKRRRKKRNPEKRKDKVELEQLSLKAYSELS